MKTHVYVLKGDNGYRFLLSASFLCIIEKFLKMKTQNHYAKTHQDYVSLKMVTRTYLDR